MNQGAQIVEFVNAVLDAVIAIANGGSAGVPKMVETALAASVPLLIGFLASLLGIGSLANKVKSVFHAVSRPVNRAIDKIVNFIAKKGKALWSKPKGKNGKNKDSGQPTGTSREKQAIIDADRMLSAKPNPESATTHLAEISKRHNTPLHLLTKEETPKERKVQVQTMVGGTHSLPLTNGYDPTKQTAPQLWRDMKPDQRTGESVADAAERSRRARDHLANHHFSTHANIFRAMTEPDAFYGQRPRTFKSYEDEHAMNSNSHVGKRHVLGEGAMLSEELVALRALRNKIYYNQSWTNAFCGGRSSVFRGSGDASASLRGFNEDYLIPAWEDLRLQILSQGYIRITGQPLRGRAMGYSKSVSGSVPIAALPAYLDGKYSLSGCAGVNPLFPHDTHISSGTPMTDMTAPTTFLVAIKPDASCRGGWYIDSAYPE
ncbi:hypothetical protein ACFQ2K_28530 [Streptomyces sanglieri]|uniref:Type IV secretion protein Rhs n=1 Tax=Streptomyces sanglieri TaxID=193460 RepID=A0ABW2WX35_9ACTN